MNIGDKFKDQGGATRIVTDLVNDGPGGPEEVGYRIDGVPSRLTSIVVNDKKVEQAQYPKHFQSGMAFLAECVAVVDAPAQPAPAVLNQAPEAPQKAPKRR